jgi:hypothetical protein
MNMVAEKHRNKMFRPGVLALTNSVTLYFRQRQVHDHVLFKKRAGVFY